MSKLSAEQSPSISASEAASAFGALAHPMRLEIFRLLVRYLPYGLAAGDVGRLMAVPHNTLSTQLAALERAGFLQSRREGRSIIFAAAPARAREVAAFLSTDKAVGPDGASLDSPPSYAFPAKRAAQDGKKTYTVLIVCTANSARSIFAESILSKESSGRFRPFSAGSRPKQRPNPAALSLLNRFGYDISQCRAKSWNEFAAPAGPAMDFVITVCDVAASEAPPVWLGRPLTAHWGIPDPVAIAGSEADKQAAFVEAYRRLAARISAFVNLDLDNLDRTALQRRLRAIGGMEGATEMAHRRMRA